MVPRTIEITVPPDQTDTLVAEIRSIPGLIGMRLHKGISLHPRGDVLSVQMTTTAFHALMPRLAARGIARGGDSSVTTSDPGSLVARPMAREIAEDKSEASWEEMEQSLAREGNMTSNGLALMFLAGVVAAMGIATNALHIVIGAMVIAPGFEPIVRMALGTVVRGVAWQRGAFDLLKGYGAIIIGAALAAALLDVTGYPPLGGEKSYLPAGVLVTYWTELTFPALMVSVAAAVAGAFVIIANRSVLTAGVMIALALVPSATIIGMALVQGEGSVAGASLLRWLVDVVIVYTGAVAVFAGRRFRQGRGALLTYP
jgi:hypothetical protein